MEKYGRTGQATGDIIIRLMLFAYCISKATDTHSEKVILISFLLQQWLNAPQCYAIRTLPVLYNLQDMSLAHSSISPSFCCVTDELNSNISETCFDSVIRVYA